MEKRILIGRITAPHGVKGLVKILPFCEDTALLNGAVFTSESGTEKLEITLKNALGKYVLAQVKSITTREQAEKLKTPLYATREALPEIKNEGEYYISDLIGMEVFNADNQKIGTLQDVQNFGAGDLLDIQPLTGKSYYVPFRDEYVKEIRLSDKVMIVTDIEGFIFD